jgi:hypothetical protein
MQTKNNALGILAIHLITNAEDGHFWQHHFASIAGDFCDKFVHGVYIAEVKLPAGRSA